MRDRLKTITFYIVIISIIGLLLLFSLSAPIITTNSDFSIYNQDWNGCSDLAVRTYRLGKFTPNLEVADGRELQVTQKSLNSYSIKSNSSTFMILGPKETFSTTEIDYIDNFLKSGGTVLLADDFGSGNSLLNGLNTTSRFGNRPLLDLSFDKRPDFSVVFDIREHEITKGVNSLMLNNPTYVSPGENAVSLFNTSKASWIDSNENGTYELDENKGKFPVMTLERYGKGELILLSDPSILINSMLDRLDNRKFSNQLLSYVSQQKTDIVFDESHRQMSIVYSVIYTGDYPRRTLSLLGAVIAFGVGLFLIVPGFKTKLINMPFVILNKFVKEEEEDNISKVLNNHPEWDEHKLRWLKKRLDESLENREDQIK